MAVTSRTRRRVVLTSILWATPSCCIATIVLVTLAVAIQSADSSPFLESMRIGLLWGLAFFGITGLVTVPVVAAGVATARMNRLEEATDDNRDSSTEAS